jgi:hypothetical protein
MSAAPASRCRGALGTRLERQPCRPNAAYTALHLVPRSRRCRLLSTAEVKLHRHPCVLLMTDLLILYV